MNKLLFKDGKVLVNEQGKLIAVKDNGLDVLWEGETGYDISSSINNIYKEDMKKIFQLLQSKEYKYYLIDAYVSDSNYSYADNDEVFLYDTMYGVTNVYNAKYYPGSLIYFDLFNDGLNNSLFVYIESITEAGTVANSVIKYDSNNDSFIVSEENDVIIMFKRIIGIK